MILSFKRVFPPKIVLCKGIDVLDKITKYFPSKDGIPKIHTIRADKKRRWRQGLSIQFWEGSPRNMHNSHALHFANGVCAGVQEIRIRHFIKYRFPSKVNSVIEASSGSHIYVESTKTYMKILIDGKELSVEEIQHLVLNDGFADIEAFAEWFKEDFDGVLIHWTQFLY